MAFAFEIPLCLAQAPDAERLALLGFAQDLGLAYQIVDDLTDEEADTDVLRRRTEPRGHGANGAAGAATKVNFVTLFVETQLLNGWAFLPHSASNTSTSSAGARDTCGIASTSC